MSFFPSKIASERGLVKPEPAKKVVLTSFETQKGHLLTRLEQSLADAKGRYVEGKSYSQAKPSKNWRVTKEADSLEDEVVTVYLQVGKRLVDSAGPEGVGKKHKLKSADLVPWLEEQLENVGSLTNDGSELAEWFRLHAKDASEPTSPKFVGRYVPELDRWVAFRDEVTAAKDGATWVNAEAQAQAQTELDAEAKEAAENAA